MKKITIVFCFICGIVACNSTDSGTAKEENTVETEEAPNPEIEKGLDLIAGSDCLTCHKVVDALVGPAYEAIAARYPDNDAVLDSVSKKIITGGAGNWGVVPMTPHPDITEADARLMTKYILSLK